MPYPQGFRPTRRKIYALLILCLVSVFFLSMSWEFWLESPVMEILGLPYDGDFETAEKWRFVLTSTGFALLSMIVPAILVRRLLLASEASYVALITAQARYEALARHDPLSGLLNRRIFHEQLTERLRQSDCPTSVMLLDIDRFKVVNETYGHGVGDQLIIVLADRIKAVTASWHAIVARLDGDEFSVAISGDFDRQELISLVQTLQSQIQQRFDEIPALSLEATIGIATSPASGITTELLLKRADLALRAGKRIGQNSYQFYDLECNEQQQSLIIDQELIEAIKIGHVVTYFQPFVRLPDRSLAGFEILARWHHPGKGVIQPLEFIPMAERLGLIQSLTEQLLRQACVHASQWPDDLILALNVTGSMIEDVNFPIWIKDLLVKASFPPHRLEIEITESSLVSNLPSARANLKKVRALGVSVALDDFGTGYSGLYHLTRLAIDKIKIDRAFLDGSESKQSQFVKAMLALGRGLDLQITAEGIEDGSLADWLAEEGCHFAQGYFFGKPMSPDDACKFVQKYYATSLN